MSEDSKVKIIVIEGPSGVGKDAFYGGLAERYPGKFEKIPSYTTRAPREGEIDGVTYYFVDEPTFLDKVESGEIIEYTERHGHYRGMSREPIDRIIASGKVAYKDVDAVGLRALKKTYPDQVVGIFVTADRDIIKKRLLKRGEKDVEGRLKDYDNAHKDQAEYDYSIVNNGTVGEGVDDILRVLEMENGKDTRLA